MYKLNKSGTYAQLIGSDEWHNISNSANYLYWISAGNIPEPADVAPVPDYSALRREAYTAESDPLFFKEQRQEVPVGTWLAKVAEIKARWPQV